MALRPVVAGFAALAVVPAGGPGRGPMRIIRLGGRLEPLERFGGTREIRGQRGDGNLLTGRALDVAKIAALVGATESNRDAFRAGARGAPDAVDILLGDVRQVEVHD